MRNARPLEEKRRGCKEKGGASLRVCERFGCVAVRFCAAREERGQWGENAEGPRDFNCG